MNYSSANRRAVACPAINRESGPDFRVPGLGGVHILDALTIRTGGGRVGIVVGEELIKVYPLGSFRAMALAVDTI